MQGLLRRRVPLTRRLALQIVLADKRFLNLPHPVAVNRLLAADSPFSRLFAGVMGVVRVLDFRSRVRRRLFG